MQKYKILEHTGDVKIKAYGKTKGELFENAMVAMMAVLHPKYEIRNLESRSIKIKSQDTNALLVDFLNEVNYLRQVHTEMYGGVEFKKFSDTEIEATLEGYRVEEFGEDVKAVTFHELDIQQNSQGLWETMIVFDV